MTRTHFKTLSLGTDGPSGRNFGGGNPLPVPYGTVPLPSVRKDHPPLAGF